MKLYLRSIAVLFYALFLASAAIAKTPVATLIVMQQDLRQNPQIVSDLAARGINHATVYLTWSDVEAEPGRFDFSAYDPYFDQLIQAGMSLIVVLDMGGAFVLRRCGPETPRPLHPSLVAVPPCAREVDEKLLRRDDLAARLHEP